MPIFKAGPKLVFYAHVPKCGGSSVSMYLSRRFGAVAFNDKRHLRHPASTRWSRTSPQHLDAVSFERLFPEGFFDAIFTIVRHPVARLISAYHFQFEVENRIPGETGFSEWLDDLPDLMAEDPFIYDNHVRPMAQIVPEGAKVFHMEHGLDALVPWFDSVTGTRDAPRSIPMVNKRGTKSSTPVGTVIQPTEWDIARIVEIYAEDFERFGYLPDQKAPLGAAPELSPTLIAERDAERADKARRRKNPLQRIGRKIARRSGL